MTTERSMGTIVAAAILLLLAIPFAAMGASLLNQIEVRGHTPGSSGGVFEALAGLGVGMLLVAAIHVVAALVLIWRGSLAPARRVGIAGLILGGAAIGLSLFGARNVLMVVLPFPLAYGAVVFLLSDWGRPRVTRMSGVSEGER